MSAETEKFVLSLPISPEFQDVLDEGLYHPAPEDWLIAVTDVVNSRKAIADGYYKAVNMAGVSLITALMNALQTRNLPYIFSGDGAAVICSPADREVVSDTMASIVTWAKEELDLELRAALIPVAALLAEGHKVMVQATRVSEAVTNYAFRGGGLSRAEELMKKGKYAVAAAPPGSRPDLTGFSCYWSPIRPQSGKIVSIIIEPQDEAEGRFPEIARQLLDLVGMDRSGGGSPMPQNGPTAIWPPEGLELEARATRGKWPVLLRKASLYLRTLLIWGLFAGNFNVGRFNPRRYKQFTSLNTDYRKYQDGLRVTVSLGNADLTRLNEFLEAGRIAKSIRYGICVQDSAILTCYVPNATSDAHFHFLDGAGGGYAQAAGNMRS